MMSPWDEYVQAARALFEDDPDVVVDDAVETESGDYRVIVRVHGDDKAESISELMPTELTYGNVTLYVDVVPDNECELTVTDHLRRAFAGNPLFVDVMELSPTLVSVGATYALFMPECVQYYSDDLGSPYGATTLAVEEVARKVLSLPDGVFASSAEM
jgi:hypothetical protein